LADHRTRTIKRPPVRATENGWCIRPYQAAGRERETAELLKQRNVLITIRGQPWGGGVRVQGTKRMVNEDQSINVPGAKVRKKPISPAGKIHGLVAQTYKFATVIRGLNPNFRGRKAIHERGGGRMSKKAHAKNTQRKSGF